MRTKLPIDRRRPRKNFFFEQSKTRVLTSSKEGKGEKAKRGIRGESPSGKRCLRKKPSREPNTKTGAQEVLPKETDN